MPGGSRVLPVYYNAPAANPAAAPGLLPVVVFSHGLAGTRNAYSSICIELASQGYVVVALEHSDGSASCARLPRGADPPAPNRTPATSTAITAEPTNPGDAAAAAAAAVNAREAGGVSQCVEAGGGSEWCFYGGLGDKPEQLRKTRHRVAEVAGVYELMERLHRGTIFDVGAEGDVSASAVVRELPPAVADSLRGRLDLRRVAVAGHSYGGATAAAAAASLPYFKAAVSLDPWWDCFDDSWPVLSRWRCPPGAPLLVIGSEDWNTPNAQGKLKCGGENQERVLSAAAAGGGGALLVVPRGSTHGNFDDVLLVFGKSLSALLRLLGIRSSLEPRRAHHINMWCITHFLSKHMPALPPPQEQLTTNNTNTNTDSNNRKEGAVEDGEGQPPKGEDSSAPLPPLRGGTSQEGHQLSTPVQEDDLEPYKRHVGEWAAILRVVAGRAAAGVPP
ncbi:hypothetical protein VOLCADRAFT_120568 [Volvox carteri f. nagariensis]|uniref:1-alkyl-2-acetylglycerophosphocholine esterase n=1 Tax=Volvox carteri f. nagariensis TaxID=3068 RepID=D8TNZ4_VOLCA|nr:uncharacterized protein VOLCADRAFT_120568 [Volvox carteri f. nagariensis]EFJ50670.1 hypothetical protein VOLCADRAFT_120568 [Volvox carteri f. nagariensis]|eukprot:XP_002948263.1 hypothetical protein VOLCADRAFT_120568 [Volvox carteri f. nagariensis]